MDTQINYNPSNHSTRVTINNSTNETPRGNIGSRIVHGAVDNIAGFGTRIAETSRNQTNRMITATRDITARDVRKFCCNKLTVYMIALGMFLCSVGYGIYHTQISPTMIEKNISINRNGTSEIATYLTKQKGLTSKQWEMYPVVLLIGAVLGILANKPLEKLIECYHNHN